MPVEPRVNAITYLDGHGRVDEVCRTYLDGRSSSHQELNGVGGSHDAAKPHNRNLNSPRHLPHHAQGNGFDGRPREPAGLDAQHRLATLNVNSHTHQRIDERHGIGAFCLTRAGNIGNIRHVRRELHYQRLVVSLPDGTNHTLGSGTCHTEGHTAVLDVGTRDIQLDGGNMLQRINAGSTLGIVVR